MSYKPTATVFPDYSDIQPFDHRSGKRGVSARAGVIAETLEYLDEQVERGVSPVLPNRIDKKTVEQSVIDYAQTLAVEDHLEDAYKAAQSALLDEYRTELGSGIDQLVANIRADLEKASRDYIEAASALPKGFGLESEDRPAKVDAYYQAVSAKGNLNRISKARIALGKFDWNSVETPSSWYGNAQIHPAYELTVPKSPNEYLALRSAVENPDQFTESEREIGAVYLTAARNGISFGFIAPREAVESAQALTLEYISASPESVLSGSGFSPFAGIA